MLLKNALKESVKFLKSSENESPAFEAGVILCHVLKCQRTFLYAHDNYKLNEKEYKEYTEAILKRAKGTPLQHITGYQEFMSLDFKVTSDVLIPRQDTEVLVETVLKYVQCIKNRTIDILDIGTGSGCIAVSLAHYIKNSEVVAVDISQKALTIAQYNAEKNNVLDKMNFICGDIFTGIKNILSKDGKSKSDKDKSDKDKSDKDKSDKNKSDKDKSDKDKSDKDKSDKNKSDKDKSDKDKNDKDKYDRNRNNKKKFDVIVSNPPYIASHIINSLEKQVKDFEPLKALDGGSDGLDFYKFLTVEAAKFLKKQGMLVFEVGINQARDVCGIMEKNHFNIKNIKDLAGIERVVVGRLKNS